MAGNDEPTNFGALLAAAKAGDEDALARVLSMTEARLRGVVDRRLGEKLRASLRRSDVLQNTYLTMLDALPRFEGESIDDFVAWVARMIEHDIHRQHRWFTAGKRKAPSQTSQKNLLASVLAEPPPTPSSEVSRNEERLQVQEALRRLEPDHAQILELAVFEELPHKEIAARLDRTEGACRMLLMRARAALAIELERLADQPGE